MTADIGEVVEVFKRHNPLHKFNIKYGYILFGITILLVLIRITSLWLYQRNWKRTGRSTSMLRLSSFPTALTVSLLALVIAILIAIKPHLERISVLIKRFGRLAYVLVPLDIFLTARPAWFPIDNYLNTIQLHKWISRLIVVLAVFHSVGFLIFYAANGKLGKVFKLANFWGFLVFVFSNFMLVFWKPIRNFNYQLFYVYHNLFMIMFVVLIYFHARPGVGLYFFINCILLITATVRKYLSTKDIAVSEIIENPGSDLKIVKFPKSLLPENYLPGCHVRIGYSKWSPFYTLLPTHPYTVSTIYEDRNLLSSLIIKQTRFQIQPFETYSIETNFNSSLSANFFNTAENVTIVCGGSGISLGLGIFEYFKRCIVADAKDIKLKFLWITKHEEDLFVLKELGVEGVEVYITNSDSDLFIEDDNNNYKNDEETVGTAEDDIELTEVSNISTDSLTSVETKFTNVAIVGRRPNVSNIVNKNLAKTIDYGNKWIVSCGPVSLINECQRLAQENKCRFFSEEYSF